MAKVGVRWVESVVEAQLAHELSGGPEGVQDGGCNIPPNEIETVVHYGRHGSNVLAVRTMGGGTRIRLEIPRPHG